MRFGEIILSRANALSFLTVAWLLMSACSPKQNYEDSINKIFQLDVIRVEYVGRDGLDGKKVYEGEDVALIESWLLSAEPPDYIGSYPKASHRMVIYFGNNETETFYVSGDESGYVMIEYIGHVLMAPPMPLLPRSPSGDNSDDE